MILEPVLVVKPIWQTVCGIWLRFSNGRKPAWPGPGLERGPLWARYGFGRSGPALGGLEGDGLDKSVWRLDRLPRSAANLSLEQIDKSPWGTSTAGGAP